MIPPNDTKNYVPIPGEKWRNIPGFSRKYWASNMGRIFTESSHGKPNNPAIMRPARSFDYRRGTKEYYKTALDGRTIVVHRIIALAWIPNPEGKPFVNHINGNKADNRAENLEWCTTSENMLHAYRTGLEKKQLGENHHAAKLTEEKVRRFKREWAMRPRLKTRKEYAEEFGVSEATIKDIVRGKSWSWLNG